MVGHLVVRCRVHQDAQPAAVDHQPGNDGGELLRRDRDLEHRLGVGADGLLAQGPHVEAEVLRERVVDRTVATKKRRNSANARG